MCSEHDQIFLRSFPPVHLPPGPSAVGEGRRYVTGCLARAGADQAAIEVAALLASEVVTNAVRHGPPPDHIRVYLRGDRVRISVTDSTPVPPAMRKGDETGGFGLRVLERGAVDWGHHGQGSGKCVWFEIPLPAGGTDS